MKTADILLLANLGVDLVIDAGCVSNDEIMQIAYIVNAKGTHLTLSDATSKPMSDLKKLSELLKDHLTLDFRPQY
jgi:hypothetical protein